MDDRSDMEYEVVVLVTRGDELPKKNYEKKKHPTYETSIRVKSGGQSRTAKPHLVIKFFNEYRDLYDELFALGVGENLKINIDAPFPPSFKSSLLGLGMSEDQLQERCYMLNKWMQSVFASYHLFPADGQKKISEFLSLEDDDAVSEANKELILSLLRRKHERAQQQAADAQQSNGKASATEASLSSLAQPVVAESNANNSSNNNNAKSLRFAEDTSQPRSTTTATNSAPTPATAPQRAVSSKYSVVSEAPMLSGAEMEEYSKEAIVASFLAVSVLRGDMIPKSPEDTKTHHSYETIIRVLPWQDVILNDGSLLKEDVHDIETYTTKINGIPAISVAKVFDGYRTLMTDLEALGVFPRDHAHKAEAFNDDDFTRRRAIVIDAAFPKTFRRSSLGISLTEQQLQMRVVMLNNWMGYLLRAFPNLPPEAQDLILIFLGLKNGVHAGETEVTIFQNTTLQNILKCTFEAPLKPPPPPVIKKDKTGNKATGNTAAPATPQFLEEIYWVNGINQQPPPSTFGPADGMPEYVLNTFAAIKVTQGEKMLRKSGDSKMHSAYETRIRMLSLAELQLKNKDEVDVELYNRYSRLPPVSVTKVFDGYRSLKTALEEKRVFSKDRADANSNIVGGCVVLDAVFPPTYGKSSLGIGLTEAEKLERATMLNTWMAALLARYAQCTPEAQAAIQTFLALDEDNPAEPLNQTIHAVLKKTFRPQLKPPPEPVTNTTTKSEQKKNAKGNANKDGAQDDPTVGTGCACIIS